MPEELGDKPESAAQTLHQRKKMALRCFQKKSVVPFRHESFP
jgi:hypothetical protein